MLYDLLAKLNDPFLILGKEITTEKKIADSILMDALFNLCYNVIRTAISVLFSRHNRGQAVYTRVGTAAVCHDRSLRFHGIWTHIKRIIRKVPRGKGDSIQVINKWPVTIAYNFALCISPCETRNGF